FLSIQGFADRFAYFSSAGAMLLLAIGVVGEMRAKPASVPRGVLAAILCFVLVGYYCVFGARNVNAWIQAGIISETIPAQLKALHPSFPEGSTLLFEQIPRLHQGAYVYMNSFELAVRENYTEEIPRILYSPKVFAPDVAARALESMPAYRFRYLPNEARLIEVGAKSSP